MRPKLIPMNRNGRGSVQRGNCNMFLRLGHCNYGGSCRYVHQTPTGTAVHAVPMQAAPMQHMSAPVMPVATITPTTSARSDHVYCLSCTKLSAQLEDTRRNESRLRSVNNDLQLEINTLQRNAHNLLIEQEAKDENNRRCQMEANTRVSSTTQPRHMTELGRKLDLDEINRDLATHQRRLDDLRASINEQPSRKRLINGRAEQGRERYFSRSLANQLSRPNPLAAQDYLAEQEYIAEQEYLQEERKRKYATFTRSASASSSSSAKATTVTEDQTSPQREQKHRDTSDDRDDQDNEPSTI